MTAKLALCLLAYSERRYIIPALRQWPGIRKVVLVSSVPWNGISENQAEMLTLLHREKEIEVHVRNWRTEAEQRNFGLELLKDCDYVITLDPDEYFTSEDRSRILARLNDPMDYLNAVKKPLPCFRAGKVVTYWRDADHILSPADRHLPIIAVNPKTCRFTEHRMVDTDTQTVISSVMHHMSWVRDDQEVRTKIRALF